MHRTAIGALALLLALPALRADDQVKPHPADSLKVGRVAPDIEGEDVDGERFRLSDYRGKVVLLDFWGHW
jgi:cytochrome oxidase Cu insertion factor (SCO1/SenC/PrrC family)